MSLTFNQQNFHLSNDNKKLLNLALLLILALSIITLVSLYTSRAVRVPDQNIIVKEKIDPFVNLNVEGKSVLVYDIANKKAIYSKNADVVLPLASITKILTAVTAVELLPHDTVVTINKEFLREEGDSGLLNSERWKLADLISFSLMVSSNDGAAAIASVAGAFARTEDPSTLSRSEFIDKMNAQAKKIGMMNSRFYNESGLDVNTDQSGGYGTAQDLVSLFSYALKEHPVVLSATRYDTLSFTSLNNVNHNAVNTDTIINTIPGILGSKTGYTEIAGGNLAVVFDAGIGRPIVAVVLGSSYDGRFTDMKALVDKTFEYIEQGN
jgi:D-alanyl-D-alanine carboxypeptidase